jgi:hypothetical protein
MAQAGVGAGKRAMPQATGSNVRSTYHAPSTAETFDIEHGVPRRKTTNLSEAQCHKTRGRVISVTRSTRRSSRLGAVPEPRLEVLSNHIFLHSRLHSPALL